VSSACSLLHLAEEDDREFTMGDYEAALARWCPGCGDHAVLAAVQRLLTEEQLKPEDTVFVSGIGCSSRFPHYMKTYGFHGTHGRALPISTGIKLNRPELDVFAVMGDGDCVSIGASHWIHATRYNVDMVALLLDNNIYGLTKMQTSPTTPQGQKSNTQPQGSWLPPMNPLSVTLGGPFPPVRHSEGSFPPQRLLLCPDPPTLPGLPAETFRGCYHGCGED